MSQTKDDQQESKAKRGELCRQSGLLVTHQDRLLNMRLNEQIDEATYAHKATELPRAAGIDQTPTGRPGPVA
jgi:site-specific DNA recombinase